MFKPHLAGVLCSVAQFAYCKREKKKSALDTFKVPHVDFRVKLKHESVKVTACVSYL